MVTITMILDKIKEKGLDPNEWQLNDVWNLTTIENGVEQWGFCIVQGRMWGYDDYDEVVYERCLRFHNKTGWEEHIGIVNDSTILSAEYI